jgi:hypothetical protein
MQSHSPTPHIIPRLESSHPPSGRGLKVVVSLGCGEETSYGGGGGYSAYGVDDPKNTHLRGI